MITGNKGEWSEILVLFTLLAEGKLFAADGNLEPLEDIYFPITNIIRRDKDVEIRYEINDCITILRNDVFIRQIDRSQFALQRANLLRVLTNPKTKSTFSVEGTEEFMEQILCDRLKSPGTKKSDITLTMVDVHTGFQPQVGFSIKSRIGSAPTLLNAGETTNCIFRVVHSVCDLREQVNEIVQESAGKTSISIPERIKKIVEEGGRLEFNRWSNTVFTDNLALIDSRMDEIIAQTLLYSYRDGINRCTEIVAKLEQENPLNFGNVNAYSYKFKKFLTAVALGLKPGTQWNGEDEASGGYIIVAKDGGVVAYHMYNRNDFESYLLANTKFERASASRYGFGSMYREDNLDYMKLNLQVRFL